MTADLARLTAAQAKADEVVADVADHDGGPGPRLMVAVIDPESNTRLATCFVAYQTDGPAPAAGVGGGVVMARFDLDDFDRFRIESAREELAAAERLDLADDRAMARTIGRLEVALKHLLEVFDEDGEQR